MTALASGTVMVPAWRAKPCELIAKAHINQAFGRIEGYCSAHERPDIAPEVKRMYRRLYEQTLVGELSGYNGKVRGKILNKAVRRRPGKHRTCSRTRRRQRYIKMLVDMGLAEAWRGSARARLANGERVHARSDANDANDLHRNTVTDRFYAVKRRVRSTNINRTRRRQPLGSRRGESARTLQRDADGRFISKKAKQDAEGHQAKQNADSISVDEVATACAIFEVRLPRAQLCRMGATWNLLYEAGWAARKEKWRSRRTRRLRMLALIGPLNAIRGIDSSAQVANDD